MMFKKAFYLKKLTSKLKFKNIETGKKLQGSTPPSVFVGSYGYPKVFFGPMVAPLQNTEIFDMPEVWLNYKKEDIVNFRLSLVRGKKLTNVREKSRFLEKMQEIVMAKNSVSVEAEFEKKPYGKYFHEEIQPFGPSAELKNFYAENSKFDQILEKVYYDTDMKAFEAMLLLYKKNILASTIQKMLSIGALGIRKQRKLVPTRWSITAFDSTISNFMLKEIRNFSKIENFRLYEYSDFNNYFAILMLPSAWQYEFIEAFINVLGKEKLIFSDHEFFHGKKSYAEIGGCYYAARLAIAEKLKEEKRQASIIVFREAYHGYIPLGVWLVRECMRKALSSKPFEFVNLKDALEYVQKKLYLPFYKYFYRSKILKNFLTQKKISS